MIYDDEKIRKKVRKFGIKKKNMVLLDNEKI